MKNFRKHTFAIFLLILTLCTGVFAQQRRGGPQIPHQELRRWIERYVEMQTVADDGRPWTFNNHLPTVAIGDLHGDFNAFLQILNEMQLIDPATGRWLGKSVNLVLVGDLINGAGQSRMLLEYLMQLQPQINASQGQLHLLVGNHEVEVSKGDEDKMPRRDQREFTEFSVDGEEFEQVEDIFKSRNRYTRFLSQFQMMVKVNGTLFVHAGIQGWMLINSNLPGAINSTWRAWQKYWSSHREDASIERPPRTTRWIFNEEDGPAHLQDFRMHQRGRHAIQATQVQFLLNMINADRLVKGHNMTPDERIQLAHPELGSNVVSIDTGISEAKGGRISALLIDSRSGETVLQAYHFDRPSRSRFKAIRDRMKGFLQNRCETVL